MTTKSKLKDFLGDIPWMAEAYWQVRQPRKPGAEEFNLSRLDELIPAWRSQVEASLAAGSARLYGVTENQPGKKILVFATLRYWIEHATLLALAFAGQGHDVSLAYLPYARWQKPISRFDLSRQNIYAMGVLQKAQPLIEIVSLLNNKRVATFSQRLVDTVGRISLRDTQYTLQVEQVDPNSELYHLRLERNAEAAQAIVTHFRSHQPDLVVVPNGTILEFGVVYSAARYLGIPVITYEFGEQRQRIWLAQNAEVMRQETDDLWQKRHNQPLAADQLEQVRSLFASRQRASLWENFARRWQGTPSQGGEKVREALHLDPPGIRPVVLLATNVIGDSLTLGRQAFSDSMTEWLERTVEYFAQHRYGQLVIRIHPGELITKGPSVADVVKRILPELPENIHLIPADAKINTYDIVEITDLGLVYTTTVGMEMAMSGVPVIAVGRTHYRNKGFTLDPDSWEGYFQTLDQTLENPQNYRLSEEQVNCAWNYAYRFFFEYPHPFPWHLLHIWDDLQEWPLSRVLSQEGYEKFGKTFGYLIGEPIIW